MDLPSTESVHLASVFLALAYARSALSLHLPPEYH